MFLSGVARERNSHWRRRKKLNRKTPAYHKLTYLLTVAYLENKRTPAYLENIESIAHHSMRNNGHLLLN